MIDFVQAVQKLQQFKRKKQLKIEEPVENPRTVFGVVVLHGVCRSLLGLSEMALINALVFVVSNILHNLVFM